LRTGPRLEIPEQLADKPHVATQDTSRKPSQSDHNTEDSHQNTEDAAMSETSRPIIASKHESQPEEQSMLERMAIREAALRELRLRRLANTTHGAQAKKLHSILMAVNQTDLSSLVDPPSSPDKVPASIINGHIASNARNVDYNQSKEFDLADTSPNIRPAIAQVVSISQESDSESTASSLSFEGSRFDELQYASSPPASSPLGNVHVWSSTASSGSRIDQSKTPSSVNSTTLDFKQMLHTVSPVTSAKSASINEALMTAQESNLAINHVSIREDSIGEAESIKNDAIDQRQDIQISGDTPLESNVKSALTDELGLSTTGGEAALIPALIVPTSVNNSHCLVSSMRPAEPKENDSLPRVISPTTPFATNNLHSIVSNEIGELVLDRNTKTVDAPIATTAGSNLQGWTSVQHVSESFLLESSEISGIATVETMSSSSSSAPSPDNHVVIINDSPIDGNINQSDNDDDENMQQIYDHVAEPQTSMVDGQIDDSDVTETRANLVIQLEAERRNLVVEAERAARTSASISSEAIADVQTLLRLFGIPFIISASEAEAQCAFLEQANLTQGTITDDNDIFLFGGKVVYRNFWSRNKPTELLNSSDITSTLGMSTFRSRSTCDNSFSICSSADCSSLCLTHMRAGLDREGLIRLAYLLGCDYDDGVKGIGVVTAMEILADFKGPDPLRDFRYTSKS
jgi:hypothetical protein